MIDLICEVEVWASADVSRALRPSFRRGPVPFQLMLTLLLGLGLASAMGAATTTLPGAAPAAKVYRIAGVAVNGRDGTPIPKARITVTEVERGVRVRPGGEGGPPRGEGFVRGGPGGFQGSETVFVVPRRGGPEANGSQDPEPVFTDGRGRFSVTVPHQGTYRVAGSARGFRQQTFEQQGNFFAGVVLTPGAPAMDNLTLKLTADGTISGIVFDEAGDGVRNAQVRAEVVQPLEANTGQAQLSRGTQFTQTDDRGHYELSPLAPGRYLVRVTARPWYANGAGARFGRVDSGIQAPSQASPDPSLDVVYAETWYPAATDAGSAETIVLSGGEERQADFHLTPIPSIHLRIPRPPETAGDEGRRGSGAPMVSRAEAGGIFGFGGTMVTTTAEEWDIGGLSPGTYQVRMGPVEGGGQTMTQVTLGGGQTTVGLSTVATGTVPVEVSVDGVPDRQVRQITLMDTTTRQSFQAGSGRRGGRMPERDDDDEDDDAKPRTAKVPAGTYEVYLSGTQGLFLTGLTVAGAEVKGRTVTVSGAMKMTVHAATGLGQVEGVARRDGKAMVGGLVLLVPAGYGRPDNLAPVREDETNTDGSFTVRGVIPGEYILVAIDQGWGVNWRDAMTLMGYLAKGVAVDLKGDGVVKKDLEGVAP